ncbi:hypothetical protein [Salinicola sp. CPA57]|uniref:hypothetical protein n=1 Tax=Salinicola sp. CPA57 TaxID=1949080 RepID=UPI000DA262CA|nr:hypothetical protein [Salinicola sp. CPA57]
MGSILAGRVLPWGLVGGLALVAWLAYDGQSSRADLAEVRQAAAEDAAEVAMTTADWQRTQFESAIQALDDRQATLEAAAEWIEGRRADLGTLEDDDGENAEWLARPLPADITDWVRLLPREGATAEADVSNPPRVPDRPSASAGTVGD